MVLLYFPNLSSLGFTSSTFPHGFKQKLMLILDVNFSVVANETKPIFGRKCWQDGSFSDTLRAGMYK